MPSDPQKVSRIRVINRAYAALDNLTQGGIAAALANDAVLRNATRFALKLTVDASQVLVKHVVVVKYFSLNRALDAREGIVSHIIQFYAR